VVGQHICEYEMLIIRDEGAEDDGSIEEKDRRSDGYGDSPDVRDQGQCRDPENEGDDTVHCCVGQIDSYRHCRVSCFCTAKMRRSFKTRSKTGGYPEVSQLFPRLDTSRFKNRQTTSLHKADVLKLGETEVNCEVMNLDEAEKRKQ
jgi:hypothetical protein